MDLIIVFPFDMENGSLETDMIRGQFVRIEKSQNDKTVDNIKSKILPEQRVTVATNDPSKLKSIQFLWHKKDANEGISVLRNLNPQNSQCRPLRRKGTLTSVRNCSV